MEHERALLQAIRERPDDDGPRLVYADWLEEQGGAARSARAAFIRIQCRLAAEGDDAPHRDALEDEAAELLAEYEPEWTRPLHGLAEDWRFCRGFVEDVTARAETFLMAAEGVFEFTPLRRLQLLIPPRDVPSLAACSWLRWVEELDFRRCHLNDRALQHLLTSPHLQRLHALGLQGNAINTPGVQSLIHSPVFAGLRRLDLGHNLGVGDRAVSLLERAPAAANLEALSLAHTNVGINGIQQLFQSPHLIGLRDLNIAGARFAYSQGGAVLRPLLNTRLLLSLRRLNLSGTVHPTGLPLLLGSPQVSRLQELRLYGIGAEAKDITVLAETSHLAGLRALDLGGNNLGAEGAKVLANCPHLVALERLDLHANNLRDGGARALAQSPHLGRLVDLDLSRNGIGGPGLKALAASPDFGRLRRLFLGGNFIAADSVRALAESPNLAELTCLDLGDACLEEDSARALASAANLRRLSALILRKNQLGDGGARALARSPHLRRLTVLDLHDNRIGKAGAEALASGEWRRVRRLDLRGNVFTDTQEALLRERFGGAVLL